MNSTKTQQNGFTLIEVLIVVALIGILSAIAFPSYSEYAKKVRRSDGHLALLSAVQGLERCRVTSYAYTGCTLGNGTLSDTSPEDNYTIALTITNGSAYSLLATAKNKQASDTDCATMGINQLGVKSAKKSDASDNADCWE